MASTQDTKQPDAETQQDELKDLKRIAEGFGITFDGDEYSNDELLRLGIGYGIPGPLADEQVRREAAEILSEWAEIGETPEEINGEGETDEQRNARHKAMLEAGPPPQILNLETGRISKRDGEGV